MEQECVGAIVCKLDMHKKMFRRGYIAMLAVDSKHRRKSIGENPRLCKTNQCPTCTSVWSLCNGIFEKPIAAQTR